MFKEKVNVISREFKRLAKKQKNKNLLKNRVSKKLESSLEQYYENLEQTVKYLASRNPVTVLKGVVKKYGKDSENGKKQNN